MPRIPKFENNVVNTTLLDMKIKFLLILLLLVVVIVLVCCGDDGLLSYEEFWGLSGNKQKDYYDSFDSAEDFFAWYNAAKAEYEAKHPGIDADDGEIDLGELQKQMQTEPTANQNRTSRHSCLVLL